VKKSGWIRRYGHRDENHTPIQRALERLGVSVLDLSPLGNDAPDMLCGFRAFDQLLEIKRDHRSKLSEGQVRFHRTWRGRPIRTIRTLAEAVEILGLNLVGGPQRKATIKGDVNKDICTHCGLAP
jgi:hypothetical protein